jgi:hypothetical protein
MMPPGNETGRRALPPKRENRGRKKEIVMRKLAFVLAATATLGFAAPASAQSVYFGAGPGGVGVGVGPSWYYDRGWGGNYGYYAYDDRDSWGGPNYGECRIVRVQRQRPDGTISVRTRRVCD